MLVRMEKSVDALAQIIKQCLGHQFTNLELLKQAATHASACDSNASEQERLSDHNERMEFLGDTLLGASIGKLIYQEYPDANEGELSRIRSHLVSRQTLARAIEQTAILDHCRIGNNLQKPWPDSVKANIAEAILGAVFLDAGWAALDQAVQKLLGSFAESADQQQHLTDAKNQLQTWALKQHKALPSYQCQRDGGTDHEPRFTCTVHIADKSASASGSSKRQSEAKAAQALLEQIKQQEG